MKAAQHQRTVTVAMSLTEAEAQLRFLDGLAASWPAAFDQRPRKLRDALAGRVDEPSEAARMADLMTAFLAGLADMIDEQLDDEHADRQYILEQLEQRIRRVLGEDFLPPHGPPSPREDEMAEQLAARRDQL